MPRNLAGALAIAISLLSATAVLSTASATPAHGKRHAARHWHGYGFLPGYRTPEQIEADEARHPNRVWWYGGPRFYRGRWNGGGFGPCWTQTPIGNVWNCGR